MSQFSCPSCGRSLKVIPLSGTEVGSSWKPGQTLSLGSSVPKRTSYSREVPTVDMSGIEAGLKTPLAQSGITALATGALAVVGVVWQGWHWTAPIVVIVATFGLSWYLLLTSNRRLLRVVERVDRPVEVEQVATFNVEVTESFADGQKRMTFAQFPASARDVKRFAIAALNQHLTVHGAHRLSRGVFERLRDEALSRGLCVWKNAHSHNQGCETTAVGRHVFKRLSD